MYGVFKKEPAPEQQPIALKSEDGTESRWMLDVVNGMSFPILSSEVTIGRISKKDPNPTPDPHHIRLADPTRTVSKTHARLVFRDVWYIEDLGSTNGVVLIDGVESETEVVPGELVIAGSRFLLGTLEVRLRRLP